MQCESEIGLRGNAGFEAIANQPRQFAQRQAFACSAQIGFIGETFLIEAQHVGHTRIGVQQRNGKIITVAGAQFCQRRIFL
ncbi:MAG: hypothetical protein WAQ56_00060 [Candidatus Nitrotoga sp.]